MHTLQLIQIYESLIGHFIVETSILSEITSEDDDNGFRLYSIYELFQLFPYPNVTFLNACNITFKLFSLYRTTNSYMYVWYFRPFRLCATLRFQSETLAPQLRRVLVVLGLFLSICLAGGNTTYELQKHFRDRDNRLFVWNFRAPKINDSLPHKPIN